MDWSEDIFKSLPVPDDREPPELRADIRDELADHLACALRREQLKTTDEETAARAVLNRFGNPRRIARQLWFDHMKEKLMSQRITLVLVAILAVASVATSGLAWVAVKDGRNVQAALLKQQSEMMDKLLAMKSAPAVAAPAPAQYLDWIPVTVELTSPEGVELPLSEYQVRLSGSLLNEKQSLTLHQEPDDDNRIDFGMVRPGSHHLSVTAPWGDGTGLSVNVTPGKPFELKVPCLPKAEPASIAIQLPSTPELSENIVWLLQFEEVQRQADEYRWSSVPSKASLNSPYHVSGGYAGKTIVVTSTGMLDANATLEFLSLSQLSPPHGIGMMSQGPSISLADALKAPSKSKIVWYAGKYDLKRIVVVKSSQSSDKDRDVSVDELGSGGSSAVPNPKIIAQMHSGVSQRFIAKPGENEWTIEMPDELSQQLKARGGVREQQ